MGMTIKQALETINGAEIMSLNTPIRKLQMAVVALMSAAKRCMSYDEQFFNGELEKVIHCCDCKSCTAITDSVGCAKLFCERWKGHPEVDPTDFCSYGERRTDNDFA